METANDYFANLERVRRFPFSLYHRPIERNLERFLSRLAAERQGAHVLVVGCGLMQELDRAPAGLTFTAADVDERAVAAVRSRSDPRVRRAVVVAPEADLSRLGSFDAVYAKEVIEHIDPWREYLRNAHRAIRPGGRIWLSTPNYGEPFLPMIEATLLELVARRGGFTRKGLHPSRFSRRALAQALFGAGFSDVSTRVVSFRLALTADARKT